MAGDFRGLAEAPVDDYEGFFCQGEFAATRFPTFNSEVDFNNRIELVSAIAFGKREFF